MDDESEPEQPASSAVGTSGANPKPTGIQDLDDDEFEEDELDEEGEKNDGEKGNSPQLTGKKKSPARRSKRASDAASKAADVASEIAKAGAAIDITKGDEPLEPPPKHSYNKTGMFSKDIEKATLALAKHGKAALTPSTPSKTTISSAGILRSTKCTPLELAEIAKLKLQHLELKSELKVKESEILALKSLLTAAVNDKVLAVSNKELECKLQ
eukprot:5039900-Pleurochrysis_carterae.AAC.1